MLTHRSIIQSATPWLLLALIAVAGCAHRTADIDPQARRWQHARQLVLVTVPDWNADHGSLRTYERDGDRWRETGPSYPVTIGRAGAAWGLGLHSAQRNPVQPGGPVKREGDGRSPAGVFAIGTAFGYAPAADTALPYAAMQASHYCIDVNASPMYNQIVDARVVGKDAVTGSTEPMRRDLHADGDQRYRLGFVIQHNTQRQPAAGSCIFAHLWKAPAQATAGCTAMDPVAMAALLSWLKPDQQPIFVLLPQNEYARLQSDWQLPDLQSANQDSQR